MKQSIHPRFSGVSGRGAMAFAIASVTAFVVGCIEGDFDVELAGAALVSTIFAFPSILCFDVLEFAGRGKGTAAMGFIAALALPVGILTWLRWAEYGEAIVEECLPLFVTSVSAAFIFLVSTKSSDDAAP